MNVTRYLEKKMHLLESFLSISQKMKTELIEEIGPLFDQRYEIMLSVDNLNAQHSNEPIGPECSDILEKINSVIREIQATDALVSKRFKKESDNAELRLKEGNIQSKYMAALKNYIPEEKTGRIIDERK